MLSRRKVLTSAAALFATGFIGSQESASAFSNKKAIKKKGKKKKSTKVKSAPPSSLDPAVMPTTSMNVIFYSPHPDDELLSFGLIASEYVELGYQVVFVLLTSGSTTAAVKFINGESENSRAGTRYTFSGKHDPAVAGYSPLSLDDVGRARVIEFKSSAGEMSVTPDRIHTFDLLENDVLPVQSVEGVINQMASRYPGAIHWTMSTMDMHPHHRAAGEALRLVTESTKIQSAHTISRTTWTKIKDQKLISNPTIPATFFFKPLADRMKRVHNAVLPYNAWNPLSNSYAIGYTSVPKQFEDLENIATAQYTLTTPTLESVERWITVSGE